MIKEMLDKAYNKFMLGRNRKWIKRHGNELNEKYNGKLLLIVNCEVVAVGSFLSDMPHSDTPGAIYCQTNIVDPCKYFGINREDFGVIKKEK